MGAGVDELAFTTENTKDTPQRVLPTMAVVIGMGGLPFAKIGSFNPRETRVLILRKYVRHRSAPAARPT